MSTKNAQEALIAAQAELRRLQTEQAALPGNYQDAVAYGDATRMLALKRRSAELGEHLAAQQVLVARAEVAALEERLHQHRATSTEAADREEAAQASADWAAAKEAMDAAEQRRLGAIGRMQMHAQTRDGLVKEHSAARRRLEALTAAQQMAVGA